MSELEYKQTKESKMWNVLIITSIINLLFGFTILIFVICGVI